MNYPRIACYSGNRSSGLPFIKADGTLDEPLLRALARHDIITMDIAPWLSLRMPNKLDAIQVMRRANPECRILAYHLITHWYWPPTHIASMGNPSFQSDWHETIRATAGWETGTIVPGYEVDWAKRATADALTELLCRVARARVFDGMFLDYLSPVNDVAAEWNMRRAVERIRATGGPGFIVLGNGINAERLGLDGVFREGFAADERLNPLTDFNDARAAFDNNLPWNWLLSNWYYPPNNIAAAVERRFALGTGCLFGAVVSFGPGRDTSFWPPYQGWWADEYSVGPDGRPDATGAHTGWLGEPWEPAENIGLGLWVRRFAGGVVVVNTATVERTFTGLPRGLYRIGGEEMGSITVSARSAEFLWRQR